MAFTDEEKLENNLSDFKELKRNRVNINSPLSVWIGKFNSLHADVDATKQAELDVMKTEFIQQLKDTMGL